MNQRGASQRMRSRGDHPVGWWAFVVHRVSGVALALFLPVHFWALGKALEGEAALEGFLRWTENPWVRFGEWGLVVLLAAHLTGGLRVLALEFLPWRNWQKSLAAVAAGVSLLVAVFFLLEVR
ncbi:MAG: succinate dehydrogenase, cytochrome b556 subunit [Casimicrobiaceae bacterium]